MSATGAKASTPAQTATAVAALESRAPATSRFHTAWATAAASASAIAPGGIRRLRALGGSADRRRRGVAGLGAAAALGRGGFLVVVDVVGGVLAVLGLGGRAGLDRLVL